MAKKREPIRGLWEREPGSDIWWIRYRVDGVLKRGKVDVWGACERSTPSPAIWSAGIRMPPRTPRCSALHESGD
jgi:hypothetical protein